MNEYLKIFNDGVIIYDQGGSSWICIDAHEDSTDSYGWFRLPVIDITRTFAKDIIVNSLHYNNEQVIVYLDCQHEPEIL